MRETVLRAYHNVVVPEVITNWAYNYSQWQIADRDRYGTENERLDNAATILQRCHAQELPNRGDYIRTKWQAPCKLSREHIISFPEDRDMPHMVTETDRQVPPNVIVGPVINWVAVKDKTNVLTLYVQVPSPTNVGLREDYMHAPLIWLPLMRGSHIIHDITRNKSHIADPHTTNGSNPPTTFLGNKTTLGVQAYCHHDHTNVSEPMLRWLERRQRINDVDFEHY